MKETALSLLLSARICRRRNLCQSQQPLLSRLAFILLEINSYLPSLYTKLINCLFFIEHLAASPTPHFATSSLSPWSAKSLCSFASTSSSWVSHCLLPVSWDTKRCHHRGQTGRGWEWQCTRREKKDIFMWAMGAHLCVARVNQEVMGSHKAFFPTSLNLSEDWLNSHSMSVQSATELLTLSVFLHYA